MGEVREGGPSIRRPLLSRGPNQDMTRKPWKIGAEEDFQINCIKCQYLEEGIHLTFLKRRLKGPVAGVQ